MADHDRYQDDYRTGNPNQGRYAREERDRNARGRETWLDNRTGYGAEGQGYRTYGQGESGAYSGREDRSFQSDERGEDAYGASSYQNRSPSYSRPLYDRDRSEGRDHWWSDRGFDFSAGQDPGFAYGNAYRSEPSRDYGSHNRDHHRGFWNRASDTVGSWLGDDEARRRHAADQRASHHGKGPKGYKRSDARIQEDLNERLTADIWLDATHIEVKVEGSEVTLNGTVSSRDDKRYAESVSDSVPGVTHTQNNLRVDPNAGRAVDAAGAHNATLTRQAEGKTN